MKRHTFISALMLLTMISSGLSASADSSPSERVYDKSKSRIAISLPSDVFGQSFTSNRSGQKSIRMQPSAPAYMRGNFDSPQKIAAVKISPSQAKAIALRHVPGSKYRDMKLVDGMVYRVRVEKDGHRIDVYVDGNTGRVR